MEDTLIEVTMKVILLQLFEDSRDIFSIFFSYQGIDKTVIHIDNLKLVKVFMKDRVDKHLKRSEGIGQFK